jgi:hypothetical protein
VVIVVVHNHVTRKIGLISIRQMLISEQGKRHVRAECESEQGKRHVRAEREPVTRDLARLSITAGSSSFEPIAQENRQVRPPRCGRVFGQIPEQGAGSLKLTNVKSIKPMESARWQRSSDRWYPRNGYNLLMVEPIRFGCQRGRPGRISLRRASIRLKITPNGPGI